jgi:methylthioribose-1-phosphate isomerase
VLLPWYGALGNCLGGSSAFERRKEAMKVGETHYRTIWRAPTGVVQIIDQRQLPFDFVVEDLSTVHDVARAIEEMHVRGAGLIGATAAYGMAIAAEEAPGGSVDAFDRALQASAQQLVATRPTAVNLRWAVDRQQQALAQVGTVEQKRALAWSTAKEVADEDASFCQAIGQHGLPLFQRLAQNKQGKPLNVLTHCNAGWLAFVDYGTATAPIYAAHEAGLPVHVWVDETRPWNQGARLTAWELRQQGVPHTVIADNTGGHLMQHGLVDVVITGTDRTTHTGDVANKIGTYLKALAAHDNGIPFYVALPSSTFDWTIDDGVSQIPIEERDAEEVRSVRGQTADGIQTVRVTPEESPAANYSFDVTPARLVTALITERGVCPASRAGIHELFPEK